MHRWITIFLVSLLFGCGPGGDSITGLKGKVTQETFCEAFPQLWDQHIFPEVKNQFNKHLKNGTLTIKDYKKETINLGGAFKVKIDRGPKKVPITINGLGTVKNDGVKIVNPELCLTPAEFKMKLEWSGPVTANFPLAITTDLGFFGKSTQSGMASYKIDKGNLVLTVSLRLDVAQGKVKVTKAKTKIGKATLSGSKELASVLSLGGSSTLVSVALNPVIEAELDKRLEAISCDFSGCKGL